MRTTGGRKAASSSEKLMTAAEGSGPACPRPLACCAAPGMDWPGCGGALPAGPPGQPAEALPVAGGLVRKAVLEARAEEPCWKVGAANRPGLAWATAWPRALPSSCAVMADLQIGNKESPLTLCVFCCCNDDDIA